MKNIKSIYSVCVLGVFLITQGQFAEGNQSRPDIMLPQGIEEGARPYPEADNIMLQQEVTEEAPDREDDSGDGTYVENPSTDTGEFLEATTTDGSAALEPMPVEVPE